MEKDQKDKTDKTDKIDKIDKNTNWENLLDIIKKNEFYDEYSSYFISSENNGYLITEEKNNENTIFLFSHKKSITIYIGSQPKILEIYASIQIENFIQSNNLQMNDVFIKGTNIQYINIKNELGDYLANNELEIKSQKKLPDLVLKNILDSTKDYTPEEYSKYFYEYFIYEDEKQKNDKIIYEKSEVRSIIEENMKQLKRSKNIKKYKLTGPASIGKSFTLFRISRIYYNFVYINLKSLEKHKHDLFLCYSIIISELERLNNLMRKEHLDELYKIIQDNYKKNNNYCFLLLTIIECLNKNNYQPIVFIFDQYKTKYIIDGFFEKIKEYQNIKYVLCSSINDKNLREECLKTWIIKGKNLLILTEDIQDFYIYYSLLYNFNKNDKVTNNSLCKFWNLPKYKFKYNLYEKKGLSEDKILTKIKNEIIDKIDEFCVNNKVKKNEVLINLKFIIGKEYRHDNLENIIKYCPLKFFFVYITKYIFKVIPMFPFMLNVIKTELTEKSCEDYFKNKEYKFNTIESDSVKGYYFEESAKFGLQKMFENKDIYTLNEIVSMEKIIDEEEYVEEGEYSGIYNDMKNFLENKVGEEIKNDNYVDNDNENDDNVEGQKENDKEDNEKVVDKEDKENNENPGSDENYENYEEKENYDNLINEEGIDRREENNPLKDKEEDAEENEFNKLLKEFNITQENININNKNYLTKKAILLSKTIEDYRQEEIMDQKKIENIKIEQKAKKYKFNGDESFFLNQIYKKGRTLDFAYLTGEERNNKTFIGFQMKCYFENSILNNKAIDKILIKERCKKILVNSMKLFNCKITKWHYILIFYYNSSNKEENINNDNLKRCKLNGITYVFYDPVKKIFYNSSKKNIITNLRNKKILDLSDLDLIQIDAKDDSTNTGELYIKKGKIFVGKEKMIEMEKSFINDLSNICKEKNNPNIYDILLKIKEKIDLSGSLYFSVRYPIIKELINTPNDSNVYLYKQKNNDFYIALIRKNNVLTFYDLSQDKKELKNFYNVFDEEAKYYYCLGIIKKRKPKDSPIKLIEKDTKAKFNDI